MSERPWFTGGHDGHKCKRGDPCKSGAACPWALPYWRSEALRLKNDIEVLRAGMEILTRASVVKTQKTKSSRKTRKTKSKVKKR